MTANIGRMGRFVRGATGTLCGLGGVGMLVLSWPESPSVRWLLGGLLIAAGVFLWFEASKSWCAVRACGIKTPL